jgi:hypothetical protein
VKFKFYYKEPEKIRFYKKLGYNLNKPAFCQDLTKMKSFHYSKAYRFLNLRLKFKLALKTLINKKFYQKDRNKFYNFAIEFTKIYKKIKLYDKKAV